VNEHAKSHFPFRLQDKNWLKKRFYFYYISIYSFFKELAKQQIMA